LTSHAVELLDKHFDVIFTKVAGVERALYGASQSSRSRGGSATYTSTSATERSLTDRLTDMERRFEEGVSNSAAVRASAVKDASAAALDVSAPTAAAAAAAAANGGGGDVQQILVSTTEKMTIYEGVITVLNREVEKLSTQVRWQIIH